VDQVACLQVAWAAWAAWVIWTTNHNSPLSFYFYRIMTTKKSSDKKNIYSKKTKNEHNKITKLEDKVKQLQKEVKEKNDKLLRNYADLQNFQKRIKKELDLKEEETKKKYLLELIELNELLKKAYQDKNPKSGLKLMIKNLDDFLKKENIRGIECVGKLFDHNLHHAISILEKDDCRDGIVVEEIKKGYLINNELLRHSQVVVAKKKEKTER
jgi:molecular chaperone GrpE